jgi:hypothetical protein
MTVRQARRVAPLDVATAPVIAVTRQEAAWACGVKLCTIVTAINRGDLLAKRTGRERLGSWWYNHGTGRFLVGIRDLQAWLEELDPDAPFLALKGP